MSFIQAQQVRFSYDPESVDAHEVLHGVDLSIEEGEFVALLGHNGCGKSTMAKLFNGMLLPTAGKVLVDGIDTAVEETQLEVRRRVGLVLQNPDNQLVAGVVEVSAMSPNSSTSTPKRCAGDDRNEPVPAAHKVFMA